MGFYRINFKSRYSACLALLIILSFLVLLLFKMKIYNHNRHCQKCYSLIPNYNSTNLPYNYGIDGFEDLPIVKPTDKLRPMANFLMLPQKLDKILRAKKGDNEIFVINVIKSSATNVDRRNAVRRTWMSIEVVKNMVIKTIFILGKSEDEKVMQATKREQREYGDLLVADILDSYGNVCLKVLAGMQWVSSTFPSYWLYSSADDDVILNPINFHKFIQSIKTQQKYQLLDYPIMCMYNYIEADPPARNPKSKWFMDPEIYSPKAWPPYCRGGWYTIPVSMVSKLHIISRFLNALYLDDVWITGLMRMKVYSTDKRMREAEIRTGTISIKDMGIEYAPYADRNNVLLFHNIGVPDEQYIVKHVWGNIDKIKTNVTKEIYETWRKWNIKTND